MWLKKYSFLFIFIFLLIISLLFVFDLFINKAQPTTFDGPTHLTNIAQFYKAIKDGELLPRWADGFANYGMPIPIIAQQTTSYLGALFNFIFSNIIFSYNVVIFLGTFFSVLFLYLFLRLHTNIRGALLGAFLFNFAPYRILNIYIRGAVPEYFAGVFFPIILIALYKWIIEEKKWAFILLAIGITGILLTHPFTIVIYSFFYLPYLIYLYLQKKHNFPMKLGVLIILGCINVCFAGYYIIPLFLELKYFYYGTGNQFLAGQYLKFENYIAPAWYYFYKGDIGTRGHFIIFGLIESIILIVSSVMVIIATIMKKKMDLCIVFTVFAGWITVFMTSGFSIPIYKLFPLLGKIQHPWRMMSLYIYITPILIAIYAKDWSRWLIAIVIIIIALMRFPQLYGKNYTLIPESSYFFTRENLHGEILNTIWTGKTESYPVQSQKPGIIAGKGIIKNKEIHNSWRKYLIQAEDKVRMVDYTFYFPGWKVYIDGIPTTIEFQDMNYRGVITYNVPKGEHRILVKFEDTKVRKVANGVSMISIFIFIILIFIEKKYKLLDKILKSKAVLK